MNLLLQLFEIEPDYQKLLESIKIQYGLDEVEKYTNNAYNTEFIEWKMKEMQEKT